MKRRTLLKVLSAGLVATSGGIIFECINPRATVSQKESLPKHKWTSQPAKEAHIDDTHIKDYLEKIQNFDHNHTKDIYIYDGEFELLKQTIARLDRVQKLVGYGNFNLLSFDETLHYARNYPKIGLFTQKEKEFLEKIFFKDATHYGFMGNKVLTNLTTRISKSSTLKIPGSGHYLFKGDTLKVYKKIKKDIGKNIVLTSGIRGIVKQIHLFLAKAMETNGNLSRASRSLAPPGHSYHGIGDFDVGKKGFGHLNFTTKFSETNEYKRLCDLGYILIRYPKDNPYGVRYEPWHIKIV